MGQGAPWTLNFADIMPFMIPITAIVGAFAVGIVAMLLKSQAQERAHRERMFLAEKGMEIPKELYTQPERKRPNGYRAARAWLMVLGVLLIAIGIGVMITITATDGFDDAVGGVIALFIGIAFLISEKLIGRMAAEPHNGGGRTLPNGVSDR